MKRSEIIREIWEILETNTEDNISKAETILNQMETLGMAPPEISRAISKSEVAEFALQGYEVSDEDLVMVREYDLEEKPDKSKLS